MATSKSEVLIPAASSALAVDLVAKNALINVSTRTINNPGKGNCGFYAFAIGLINIIQEENTGGKRTIFDRWVQLDPFVNEFYDAICHYNFDRPNYELLERLHRMLRLTTYNQQREELMRACSAAKIGNEYQALVATSTYRKFSGLYYGIDSNPQFNELAYSEAIKTALSKIDKSTVRKEHEALVLAPLFISLVYGEGVDPNLITPATEPSATSPIIEALQRITRDFVWANHVDLDYLANAFKVNLHTLENGEARYKFHDLADRHTITVDNQFNRHWTTRVDFANVSQPLCADYVSVDPNKISSHKMVPTKSADHILVPNLSAEKGKSILKKETAKELTMQSREHSGKEGAEYKDAVEEQGKKRGRLKKQLARTVQSDRSVLLENDPKNQQKFDALNRRVIRAAVDYCKCSDSIWFSFFHHRGETGRARVKKFLNEFSQVKSHAEAQEMVLDFLNNKRNGNTHPHSFRTILLKELLASPSGNNMDLNTVSKTYQTVLIQYKQKLSSVEASERTATF